MCIRDSPDRFDPDQDAATTDTDNINNTPDVFQPIPVTTGDTIAFVVTASANPADSAGVFGNQPSDRKYLIEIELTN